MISSYWFKHSGVYGPVGGADLPAPPLLRPLPYLLLQGWRQVHSVQVYFQYTGIPDCIFNENPAFKKKIPV